MLAILNIGTKVSLRSLLTRVVPYSPIIRV